MDRFLPHVPMREQVRAISQQRVRAIRKRVAADRLHEIRDAVVRSSIIVPGAPLVWTPSKTIIRVPDRRWDRMGWPAPTQQAAVAFVSSGGAFRLNASGVVSQSFTIDATADCAIAWFAFDDDSALSVTTAPKIGAGADMTSCGTRGQNAGYSVQAYVATLTSGLTTGTQTLTATISGATIRDVYFNLVWFVGVDQTTPVRAATYATTQALTLGCTTVSGDATIGVYKGGGNGVQTVSGTSTGINAQGNTGAGSDYILSSGVSNTHTYTSAGTGNPLMLVLSLAAAGSAGVPLAWIKA